MSRVIDFARWFSTFRSMGWLFVLMFSCTIIDDSDITSQEELDNLRLKSIEIKQETNSGSSTIVAKVTTDSVINVSTPNGILKRTVWMDWPALGNHKLKLKSGITTAFKTYTSYLESGKPYTFYIFNSDSVLLELYRFRYDANGRLNKIITIVPFVDGGPATSNDTLIYETTSGILSSVIRRSADPSKEGTFTNITYQNGNMNPSSDKLDRFTFQGTRYGNPCQSGCGNYYYAAEGAAPPNGGRQLFGEMAVTNSQREYLSMKDRNSNISLSGCSGYPCGIWIDTFYFHPLMLLTNQIFKSGSFEELSGDELLFIYMVDWWQPVSTQESPNDEKVTFSFKYDL